MMASTDAPEGPAVRLDQPAHLGSGDGPRTATSKIRMFASGARPCSFKNFEHASDGLTDVVLKLIERLALRVAARERRDFAPKPAIRILVDDHGVFLHISIFAVCSWLPQTRSLPRGIICVAGKVERGTHHA